MRTQKLLLKTNINCTTRLKQLLDFPPMTLRSFTTGSQCQLLPRSVGLNYSCGPMQMNQEDLQEILKITVVLKSVNTEQTNTCCGNFRYGSINLYLMIYLIMKATLHIIDVKFQVILHDLSHKLDLSLTITKISNRKIICYSGK